MLDLKDKRVLIVAPHPDDEVIGCGGLIMRTKEAGGKVYVLYMTVGNTHNYSNQRYSSINERMCEIQSVIEYLGIDDWRLALEGDEYHLRLDQVSQRQLIDEIERGKRISLQAIFPDIIVFPPFHDYNQDHRAVAQAAFSACRPARQEDKHVPPLIMSYETPMDWWSYPTDTQRTNILLTLTSEHSRRKAKAMSLYKSQTRQPGHPRNGRSLMALAELRGTAMGALSAEAYYCHKFQIL